MIEINPLWGAVLGWLFLSDRLPARTVAAIVVGVLCALVAFLPNAIDAADEGNGGAAPPRAMTESADAAASMAEALEHAGDGDGGDEGGGAWLGIVEEHHHVLAQYVQAVNEGRIARGEALHFSYLTHLAVEVLGWP